jgi:CBS domain-containing protein
MNVSDIMTMSVHSCRLGESLNAAARIMWDHEVGCVPIVNADGYLVGLVTDRDVCMGAYTTGKTLAAISVDTAMSRKVISCRGHDPLRGVEDLMRSHQLRRLPVVDDAGRLVGILSLADLARNFEPSFEGSKRPLSGDAIALLVGASTDRPKRSAKR